MSACLQYAEPGVQQERLLYVSAARQHCNNSILVDSQNDYAQRNTFLAVQHHANFTAERRIGQQQQARLGAGAWQHPFWCCFGAALAAAIARPAAAAGPR